MALVEFQNVTRVYKTGDHELKAPSLAKHKLRNGARLSGIGTLI